ncbi:hypothetical protein PGT21_001910 [Puccinia graminis f. sp. tritici]|uniref:Uncharacterized protein n=1 Tax=Puccinia graminis f. sp. tritici TaxID=56615 RepID=A0A5B0M2J1_PUCGR|nr:hypothetical protein PGT21_001910 [Puccinia graminis f. sp. tritici]KAA1090234.1 hypothetical protein PGTUg99_037360 [Puccinia graminis f. sp. tritici]
MPGHKLAFQPEPLRPEHLRYIRLPLAPHALCHWSNLRRASSPFSNFQALNSASITPTSCPHHLHQSRASGWPTIHASLIRTCFVTLFRPAVILDLVRAYLSL